MTMINNNLERKKRSRRYILIVAEILPWTRSTTRNATTKTISQEIEWFLSFIDSLHKEIADSTYFVPLSIGFVFANMVSNSSPGMIYWTKQWKNLSHILDAKTFFEELKDILSPRKSKERLSIFDESIVSKEHGTYQMVIHAQNLLNSFLSLDFGYQPSDLIDIFWIAPFLTQCSISPLLAHGIHDEKSRKWSMCLKNFIQQHLTSQIQIIFPSQHKESLHLKKFIIDKKEGRINCMSYVPFGEGFSDQLISIIQAWCASVEINCFLWQKKSKLNLYPKHLFWRGSLRCFDKLFYGIEMHLNDHKIEYDTTIDTQMFELVSVDTLSNVLMSSQHLLGSFSCHLQYQTHPPSNDVLDFENFFKAFFKQLTIIKKINHPVLIFESVKSKTNPSQILLSFHEDEIKCHVVLERQQNEHLIHLTHSLIYDIYSKPDQFTQDDGIYTRMESALVPLWDMHRIKDNNELNPLINYSTKIRRFKQALEALSSIKENEPITMSNRTTKNNNLTLGNKRMPPIKSISPPQERIYGNRALKKIKQAVQLAQSVDKTNISMQP